MRKNMVIYEAIMMDVLSLLLIFPFWKDQGFSLAFNGGTCTRAKCRTGEVIFYVSTELDAKHPLIHFYSISENGVVKSKNSPKSFNSAINWFEFCAARITKAGILSILIESLFLFIKPPC